jgi:hypothetical protein
MKEKKKRKKDEFKAEFIQLPLSSLHQVRT